MKKKVIIWTTGIDDLIAGEGVVGGLTVQMMFWASAFIDANWKVYSFTNHNSRKLTSLNLIKFPQFKFLSAVCEAIYSIYIIIKFKPELILFRGASRSLFIVSRLTSLLNIKIVFFGASDVNFIKGKEGISGREYNKKLFRMGLEKISKIVVQNKEQAISLYENYNKESITIPNIWQTSTVNCQNDGKIIWIGNFRALKRPEWFLRLADIFSQEQFIMAGYPDTSNLDLFEKCENLAVSLKNLTFMGGISFTESEKLFDGAKILICTSEYEGFPNTFLQAWSRSIPVISTVNPNNLITEKGLGIMVKNEVELELGLKELINKEDCADKIKQNISSYFKHSHCPNIHYKALINFIYT